MMGYGTDTLDHGKKREKKFFSFKALGLCLMFSYILFHSFLSRRGAGAGADEKKSEICISQLLFH